MNPRTPAMGRTGAFSDPEVERARYRETAGGVEHLHGPEDVPYEMDELVAVCLVRDGEPWVRGFMDHHFSLGVKHIVLMDNGSEDATIEIAREYENVTILKTAMPFKTHQVAMRRYLIERFGKGRWVLCVDIDEMFDYPYSDVVNLGEFLGYLGENSYTALVTQTLDMFSEEPLSEAGEVGGSLREMHRFYDLSNVRRGDYRKSVGEDNEVSNEGIDVLRGGVQATVSGLNALLTRHPLIFVDDEIEIMSGSTHRANKARLVDVSGVIRHYRFTEDFAERVVRAVEEKNYANDSARYKKYLEAMEKTPNLVMKRETSKELGSVNDLVSEGFLNVSRKYMEWVDEKECEKKPAEVVRERPSRLGGAFCEAESKRAERASFWVGGAGGGGGKAQSMSSPSEKSRPKRKGAFSDPEREKLRDREVAEDVEHLHGPEEIPCGLDELVVTCLVRDGEPWVRGFMEHHFSLGVKHIVLMDNGSEDATIEIAREYENVTILKTAAPFKTHQVAMRRYLIRRFGAGRWMLYLDIDEMFDYPYSDVVDLKELLGYLNRNRYTALASQTLDMFPDKPLWNMGEDEDSLKEAHRFYDLSNVREQDYQKIIGDGNEVSNDAIRLLRGGIQTTLSGHLTILTRHPLTFLDDEIEIMGTTTHKMGKARIADFTAVILHYRFTSDFHNRAVRAVREESHGGGSIKYKKYLQALEESPGMRMRQETSKELGSVNDLVAEGFLDVSEDYMVFVGEREEESAPPEVLRRRAPRLGEAFHEAGAVGRPPRAEAPDRSLKRLESELARVRKRRESLEEETRNLAASLRSIQNSRSWKLLGKMARARRRLLETLPSGRR